MKAPATHPDPVRCHGCQSECDYPTRELARKHGWRIAWTPEQPSWCHDCYQGGPRPKPGRGSHQPYDEPMF